MRVSHIVGENSSRQNSDPQTDVSAAANQIADDTNQESSGKNAALKNANDTCDILSLRCALNVKWKPKDQRIVHELQTKIVQWILEDAGYIIASQTVTPLSSSSAAASSAPVATI